MLKRASGFENKENEEDLKAPEYYEELSKKVAWYHRILLNKPLKVAIVIFLLAFVAPTLIFYYLQDYKAEKIDSYSFGFCSHDREYRMQCGHLDISPAACVKHCCFDEEREMCYHRMPSRYSYLDDVERQIVSGSPTPGKLYRMFNLGNLTLHPRHNDTPYQYLNNIPNITFKIGDVSASHTRFVVFDPRKVNYTFEETKIPDKKYNYTIYYREFYLEINPTDPEVDGPLLTTVMGPLIASFKMWEWSFKLAHDFMFGLGDLLLKPNATKIFYNGAGEQSSLPFFMGHRNGSFHGVYIEGPHTMVFNVTGSGVVNVKSFTEESLMVHFFHGDRPGDVIKEFRKYVGAQQVPPYWALGAHFCRLNTTDDFAALIESAKDQGMAYDSDCIQDDLFQFVNTKQMDLSNYTTILAGGSKRFLPSIRPQYDTAAASQPRPIMVMDPLTNADYKGLAFGREVAYPDYSRVGTVAWMLEFWKWYNASDSMVIKDAWPRNDNDTGNCTLVLPYRNEEMDAILCESIPWNARNSATSKFPSFHINDHNRYGTDFTSAVREMISTSPASFFMTSSILYGDDSGLHEQAVEKSWESMKMTFLSLVAKSMQGVYVQSVPVCGDTDEPIDEDLCIRWYWNSIPLPVYYIQSNVERSDPFGFSGYAARSMVKAINRRYRLLPYFYTVLSRDEPLLRAMYYDFYDIEEAYGIDEQFMIGEAVMFAPDFSVESSSISAYFPTNETWYDLWEGTEIEGGWVEVLTSKSDVHMYLRGGHIVTTHETVHSNAPETRLRSNYSMLVGLQCDNSTCNAAGSLHLNNDTFLAFEATSDAFTISNIVEAKKHVCGDAATISSVIGSLAVYGEGVVRRESGLAIDLCTLTGDSFVHNITNQTIV